MGPCPGQRLAALLGALCALVSALSDARAQPVPLPPAAIQRQAGDSIPDERPYPVRLHFLTSNERRHDLFFPAARRRGGGYVGVGADQNYTLAAVAEAEVLWLLDIDAQVAQWHQIYAALIPAAPTPADLRRLLDGQHGPEVAAALEARWDGPLDAPLRRALFLAYRRDRARIHAHVTREILRRGGAPSWLSDRDLYAHVRALQQARRVTAKVGDLHGEQTLLSISEAARRMGVQIRVVYLSNAEQWFRYSPQFRRNMAALPRDGRAVVLRTLARWEVPAAPGDRWHFSAQTLDDFVRRLQAPDGPRRVHDLMGDMARHSRDPALPRGLSLLPGVTVMLSRRPPGPLLARAPSGKSPWAAPRCSWGR